MTDEFIATLPKAELHVHLEGTLEPEMLFALAARNRVELPWRDVDEIRAAYSFTGLEHFLPLLFQAAAVLRSGQDFYDLANAYLTRAASDGVRRAEMFLGVQTFLDAGVPIADQLDTVLAAISDARADLGIDGALIVTCQRHRAQSAAAIAPRFTRVRTVRPTTFARLWTCAGPTASITGLPRPPIRC